VTVDRDELLALFGSNGVLRLDAKDLSRLSPAARAELEPLGLPVAVEYLYRAERPTEYKSRGRTYCRLGNDEGTAICADPATGHVLSVPGGTEYPARYVNSSPALFVESLYRIAVVRGSLWDAAIGEAAEMVDSLKAELELLDPGAFASPDHWWPVVLEMLPEATDPRGGPLRNTVVMEFRAGKDVRRVTCQESIGLGHGARLAWRAVQSLGLGVKPKDVLRVYSELEPCRLPGGYCEPWLRSTFPNAKVTYSFEYGYTVESRLAGLMALRAEVAKLGH
jgi:hypothetical protein